MQNMIFNFAKAREKCAQTRLKAQEEKCRSQRAAWGCGGIGMILETEGGRLVGCLPRLIALSGAAE